MKLRHMTDWLSYALIGYVTQEYEGECPNPSLIGLGNHLRRATCPAHCGFVCKFHKLHARSARWGNHSCFHFKKNWKRGNRDLPRPGSGHCRRLKRYPREGMMKKAFINCGLLRPDLQPIYEEAEIYADVTWLEPGLHASPNKLREKLQETIDSLEGYDQVLLSYSLCGNALLGIRATHCDLLYLQTDDCINVLLCEHPDIKELRRSSMFTNRSWIESKIDDNSSSNYDRMIEKYGEERAKRLIRSMYKNYQNTVYMQTETEEEVDPKYIGLAQEAAERSGTDLRFEPATIEAYRALIEGRPHRLITLLPKGEEITFEDFFNKSTSKV